LLPTGIDVRSLIAGCVENLTATYRDDGLFPYSCRLDGTTVVATYDHPQTRRYTINSLLGLDEAARAAVPGVAVERVDAMWDTFLERQSAQIDSAADLGLLTLALTEKRETPRTALDETLDRLRGAVTTKSIPHLDMQSLSWIAWGCCAATRAGLGGDDLARVAMSRIYDLVSPATGFPQHSASRYRRSIVSFGSLVYFLRACHEVASTFDDERARRLFDDGVRRAIAFQGPEGEWPWMIDVRSGKPFDVYPVFSVHQDSMAMLFLHPYLDSGESGATEAIRRSIAWCYGENELGEDLYRFDPFFAYRSIERIERLPRLRRYLRGISRRATSASAAYASASVRLNRECRSYHLGWILYAWSHRVRSEVSGGSRLATLVE
jgi:hypothetical protein